MTPILAVICAARRHLFPGSLLVDVGVVKAKHGMGRSHHIRYGSAGFFGADLDMKSINWNLATAVRLRTHG